MDSNFGRAHMLLRRMMWTVTLIVSVILCMLANICSGGSAVLPCAFETPVVLAHKGRRSQAVGSSAGLLCDMNGMVRVIFGWRDCRDYAEVWALQKAWSCRGVGVIKSLVMLRCWCNAKLGHAEVLVI